VETDEKQSRACVTFERANDHAEAGRSMRIEALTVRAVAAELQESLAGTRIDPVIAPTPRSVALCCYGGHAQHWLLLSAHPQLARAHLLAGKPKKIVVEPTTFIMLLRKYLEGGRVQAVRSVTGERILEVEVSAAGIVATVIAEMVGKLANIILVNDQRVILGALHLVGPQVNRYRTILPGQPYLPPPPQERLAPETLTGAELLAVAEAGQPWHKVLSQRVAGLGADLASEIVCRALGDAAAPFTPDSADAVAAGTRALLRIAAANAWAPTAILADDGAIVDGALLVPCAMATRHQKRMPSVNALLAAVFDTREWQEAIGSAGGDLRRTLKQAHDRLAKKLRSLREELAALDAADRLRQEAERLFAMASEISPEAKRVTAPDLGDGLGILEITLDPRLSVIENANARFTKYHKMHRAARIIPEQIARAETDLARVAQLLTDLDLAETPVDLTYVRQAVAAAHVGQAEAAPESKKKNTAPKGKKPVKGKGGGKARAGGEPLRIVAPGDFTIYAGRNSLQNEYVTFDLAAGTDLWFHARGVPGAHVIIKAGGRPVPQATVHHAAEVAAWLSQSRTAAYVPVDYTEQRYVRHMKDGGPGMVTYSKEKTISAAPRDPAS
jgi:predicted ribosome quality control (RQC) complex YloA/Tae2 family protein